MRGVTELPQPIEAWAPRHWPVLTAFGYALSFAVLFGGTALAAYRSDVADGTAVLLCRAAAILFAKLYARIVPRIQRLIDALGPPKPDEAAKSDGIPLWAVAVSIRHQMILRRRFRPEADDTRSAGGYIFSSRASRRGHFNVAYLLEPFECQQCRGHCGSRLDANARLGRCLP